MGAWLGARRRDDIDGDRIGLIGASQAGWVIPMAVAGGGAAFSVILSGGTTAYQFENLWSEWSREQETGPDLPSFEELDRRIRNVRDRRSVIDSQLRGYDCPGLWLYGLRDRSNPSELCIELLERIADEEGTDFSIASWPDANHGLMLCRWGGGGGARRSEPDGPRSARDDHRLATQAEHAGWQADADEHAGRMNSVRALRVRT